MLTFAHETRRCASETRKEFQDCRNSFCALRATLTSDRSEPACRCARWVASWGSSPIHRSGRSPGGPRATWPACRAALSSGTSSPRAARRLRRRLTCRTAPRRAVRCDGSWCAEHTRPSYVSAAPNLRVNPSPARWRRPSEEPRRGATLRRRVGQFAPRSSRSSRVRPRNPRPSRRRTAGRSGSGSRA